MIMDDSIAILGRQPALGLAELESLYGEKNVTPIGSIAAKLSIMPCSVEFSRLGGTVKLCKTLKVFDTTSWHDIEAYLVDVSPEHSKNAPRVKHLRNVNPDETITRNWTKDQKSHQPSDWSHGSSCTQH